MARKILRGLPLFCDGGRQHGDADKTEVIHLNFGNMIQRIVKKEPTFQKFYETPTYC